MIKRIFEKYPLLEAVFWLLFFLNVSGLMVYGLIKANNGNSAWIKSDKPIKPEIHFFIEDGKIIDTIYIYIKKP